MKNSFFQLFRTAEGNSGVDVNKIRLIVYCACLLFLGFVAFVNTAPFGESYTVSLGGKDGNLRVDSVDRYTFNSEGKIVPINTRLYLITKPLKKYSTASVSIRFRSTNDNSLMLVGNKTHEGNWNYATKYAYASYLEKLNYAQLDKSSLGLYSNLSRDFRSLSLQQVVRYADQTDAVVSSFGVSSAQIDPSRTPNIPPLYQKAKTPTTIDTRFRGSTSFYVYAEAEPIRIDFNKQDLNFHEGVDSVNITVSHHGRQIYNSIVKDDGNLLDNRKLGTIQKHSIQLPATYSGVLRVDISGNNDYLIGGIKTNLNKLVFNAPIYPVGNTALYGYDSTESNSLFSNAKLLSFKKLHENQQVAEYGGSQVNIEKANTTYYIKSNTAGIKRLVYGGDTIIGGDGYFAFSEDQLFVPYDFTPFPATDNESLRVSDLVISEYRKIDNKNGWKQARLEFDLDDADFENNHLLRWLLYMPNEEPTSQFTIDTINIKYRNPGWLHEDK